MTVAVAVLITFFIMFYAIDSICSIAEQKKSQQHLNKMLVKAVLCGDVPTARSLIQQGANCWFADAMECAASKGHIDIAEFIINMREYLKKTLIAASQIGDIDTVRLMIKKGANDFNQGMRAAAFRGHIDIVRLMIEHGANDFEEAIKYASNNPDIVKLLEDAKAKSESKM